MLNVAARPAGYDARMYDGSFDEWSRRGELPVVRSPTPWLGLTRIGVNVQDLRRTNAVDVHLPCGPQ